MVKTFFKAILKYLISFQKRGAKAPDPRPFPRSLKLKMRKSCFLVIPSASEVVQELTLMLNRQDYIRYISQSRDLKCSFPLFTSFSYIRNNNISFVCLCCQ